MIFKEFLFSDSEEDEEYDYPFLKSIEKLLDDEEEPTYSEKLRSNLSFFEKRNFSNFSAPVRRSSKKFKTINVFTSKAKDVSFESEVPIRSGAIIYTTFHGKTYFCMGVDASSGDLTDFAGGVKKGESPIEGGLRELKEESLDLFDLKEEEVENSLTFYSNNMMIMFVYRNLYMKEIREEFQRRLESNPEDEVIDIVWLEKKDFIASILGRSERRMYSRVKKILCKVLDIIEAL